LKSLPAGSDLTAGYRGGGQRGRRLRQQVQRHRNEEKPVEKLSGGERDRNDASGRAKRRTAGLGRVDASTFCIFLPIRWVGLIASALQANRESPQSSQGLGTVAETNGLRTFKRKRVGSNDI